MMEPKVTIGVCARNCEGFIKDALESVAIQDFSHELMEMIVVDDGSEDGTLAVINSYVKKMDVQVKVFHQEWKGLGGSRNVVVDNACGEYIVWVDADMVLSKDFVRKQVEFMDKNPVIGIAKARYGILKDENLVGFLENIGYVAVDFIYGGKPVSRTLGTGGSIYRVSSIRQVGGFDARIRGVGEDMDVENRIRKASWILQLGSPAVFYERRRKSLSALWREAFWHGYGGSCVLLKNKEMLNLFFMTPLAGFLIGTWYATVAYKMTYQKLVFLLPFEYAFKRIAWCFGFLEAQLIRRQWPKD